ACAAHIMANGAGWFRSMGTAASPGTLIASVSGDVARPSVHEVEMGTPFSELLARCGGPLPGRSFKAAFSGVSNPVLVAPASVTNANRCFLGTEEQIVVSSVLRAFPDDVAALLEGRENSPRKIQVPIIDDITEHGAVIYGRHAPTMRPDR